uniref:Immunogenic protein A n=1 Tax=Borrelia hermsii TaxID=140 RepID=D5I3N1_BORHE|nr:immunogenic protein A [Borrelia hermsii]
MDMRNLGIVIILSAFTLSCKFYHAVSESNWEIDEPGSVQDIRNSVASELQKPENIGQRGKSVGKEVGKDAAASGEGAVVAVGSKQNTLQNSENSSQEGAGSALQKPGDSPQKGVASQEGTNGALQGVVAAGGVSVGGSGVGAAASDGNSSSSQEAESVDLKNVLADSHGVGASNLNIKAEGDISTGHGTEGVIASGDLTNTIITSGVTAAASPAIVSGDERGVAAIKDSIAVVLETQKEAQKETEKETENVKFAVLGTVKKIVDGVADGIANVIEYGLENGIDNKVKDGIKTASKGAETFVTAAMQGAGAVLGSLQDVGNFVMDATLSMGDMFAGIKSDSDVSSVNSGMTVSLSSNETQVIGHLEEYLKSAIKVNGNESSRQSKLENGRQKFFAWLREKDTDFSKRKELVQAMQRVYNFIKEKSSNSRELQTWVLGVVGDDDTVVDVDRDDELNSDVEIDFLIKKTLSSRDYSGFAVSLLFQALADTLYDAENDRDKPEEQIFKDLKAAFSDNAGEDKGFGEFKSIIEDKSQA